MNKTDLPRKLELPSERRSPTRHAGPEARAPIANVSCLSGQGIEALKDASRN